MKRVKLRELEPLTPLRIKATRLALGLSQYKLAMKVGAAPVSVSYWECGTASPGKKYAAVVRELCRQVEAKQSDMAKISRVITEYEAVVKKVTVIRKRAPANN
jgi:transcriptional regulator with XRE-family HTH domain